MLWTRIPGYPGYEASTEGDIRKLGQFGVKAKSLNDAGYEVTGLSPPGHTPGSPYDILYVHRLVLATFIPNRHPWHFDRVDHINGNRADNRLVNLRWSNALLNQWNREQARGWYPNGNGYQAMVTELGKQRCLGTFETPEEARARYLEERNNLQIMYDPTNKGSYIDTAYCQINSLLRGGCQIL